MSTRTHLSRTSSVRVEDLLTLLEWKRRVFALYQDVRAMDPQAGWQRWRDVRDELFRDHPQSPLPKEARGAFTGLEYFPYDVVWRVVAEVVPVERELVKIGASAGEAIPFERFAQVRFVLADEALTLDLFWLDAYGGGVFLPFSDGTSGSETYPAGRYLLDTVKGADLGGADGQLILDFNYAYNPSCSYDPRWTCPLAPPANRLHHGIRAGERTPE